MKIRPKIQMPTERDILKAVEFLGLTDDRIFTDIERQKINSTAYTIMVKRKGTH